MNERYKSGSVCENTHQSENVPIRVQCRVQQIVIIEARGNKDIILTETQLEYKECTGNETKGGL